MSYQTPCLMMVGVATSVIQVPDVDLPDNHGEAVPGNMTPAFSGIDN